MGQILKAVCKNCYFEEEVWFGGGMLNFETECNVPAINNTTGEFEIMNIFNKDLFDGNYTFYNDPSMFKGKITIDSPQWYDIYLCPTKNLCPKCKSFKMNFESVGFFD